MNSTDLLKAAHAALTLPLSDNHLPAIAGALYPFDTPHQRYVVSRAIAEYLESNKGFTVILDYPGGDEGSYSSTSMCATWEEAVKDVAEQMFEDGELEAGDTLEIIDVFAGTAEHSTYPGADRYATVTFSEVGVAILSCE